MTRDLTALDKNLLIQGNADGLTGLGDCRDGLNVERFNGTDVRALIRRREHELVADVQPSGRNAPRKNATGIEFIDVLNREAKRLFGAHRLLGEHAEGIEDRGSLRPGHPLAASGDVVAQLCADRDDPFRRCAELLQKFPVLFFNAFEYILTIADQVHLVHDDGELTYTQ